MVALKTQLQTHNITYIISHDITCIHMSNSCEPPLNPSKSTTSSSPAPYRLYRQEWAITRDWRTFACHLLSLVDGQPRPLWDLVGTQDVLPFRRTAWAVPVSWSPTGVEQKRNLARCRWRYETLGDRPYIYISHTVYSIHIASILYSYSIPILYSYLLIVPSAFDHFSYGFPSLRHEKSSGTGAS